MSFIESKNTVKFDVQLNLHFRTTFTVIFLTRVRSAVWPRKFVSGVSSKPHLCFLLVIFPERIMLRKAESLSTWKKQGKVRWV